MFYLKGELLERISIFRPRKDTPLGLNTFSLLLWQGPKSIFDVETLGEKIHISRGIQIFEVVENFKIYLTIKNKYLLSAPGDWIRV